MEVFSVFNNVNCKTLNVSCTSGVTNLCETDLLVMSVQTNRISFNMLEGKLVSLQFFRLFTQLLMSG